MFPKCPQTEKLERSTKLQRDMVMQRLGNAEEGARSALQQKEMVEIRLMAELADALQRASATSQTQPAVGAEVERLNGAEVERLNAELAKAKAELAKVPTQPADGAEVERLNAELAKAKAELAKAPTQPADDAEVERLNAELAKAKVELAKAAEAMEALEARLAASEVAAQYVAVMPLVTGCDDVSALSAQLEAVQAQLERSEVRRSEAEDSLATAKSATGGNLSLTAIGFKQLEEQTALLESTLQDNKCLSAMLAGNAANTASTGGVVETLEP
jgi:hypothetical protein